MEENPEYEKSEAFQQLIEERLKDAEEHPENLRPIEELIQHGWDMIEEKYPKHLQA